MSEKGFIKWNNKLREINKQALIDMKIQWDTEFIGDRDFVSTLSVACQVKREAVELWFVETEQGTFPKISRLKILAKITGKDVEYYLLPLKEDDVILMDCAMKEESLVARLGEELFCTIGESSKNLLRKIEKLLCYFAIGLSAIIICRAACDMKIPIGLFSVYFIVLSLLLLKDNRSKYRRLGCETIVLGVLCMMI